MDDGLSMFEEISFDGMPKKFEKIVTSEKYYIKSIRGNYDEAQQIFLDIINSVDEIEKTQNYYTKAQLFYSDILMLKGDFKVARKNLEEILALNDGDNLSHQNFKTTFDVQKALGHIFRFNFDLDKALESYEKLDYHNYYKNTKLKSYYYTVLCETNCYFDYEKTLELFDKAVAINTELNSKNNLGKLYYSKAIALIRLGEFDEANSCFEESLKINSETEYEAGKIFSYTSKCYIDYAKGNALDNSIIQKLETLVSTLKVYEYLMLPIYLMKGEDNKVDDLSSYEWFNFELTKANYKLFLESIKPN